MQDVQRMLNLMERLWNTGSADAANELYTPDAERHDPYKSEPDRGPQGIAQHVADVRTGYPDFKVEIDATLSEGNRLVTQWTCTGTRLGTYQGIPPTGKQIRMSGMGIVQVENGKFSIERVYYDRLQILEQLGLMPAMGQAAAKATGA